MRKVDMPDFPGSELIPPWTHSCPCCHMAAHDGFISVVSQASSYGRTEHAVHCNGCGMRGPMVSVLTESDGPIQAVMMWQRLCLRASMGFRTQLAFREVRRAKLGQLN